MAFAESVSWFLRQGLTYERLTSNSSQSMCGIKVLVLLPQLAKNWGYRCAVFRAQQGLVCTAPMPCAPHLGFLICSIVLTSGDDWPRQCPHTGALWTRPVTIPQPFFFMLPSCCFYKSVHRSSCGTPALTLNSGDWRACLHKWESIV